MKIPPGHRTYQIDQRDRRSGWKPVARVFAADKGHAIEAHFGAAPVTWGTPTVPGFPPETFTVEGWSHTYRIARRYD